MIAVNKPLFKLGQVLATPGAIEALEKAGQSIWEFVSRHVSGDFGVVDADDKEANRLAIQDGSRILSAYLLNTGVKVWIITEAEDNRCIRACSTCLLSSEY